jgi:hypothetical protein
MVVDVNVARQMSNAAYLDQSSERNDLMLT